MALWESEYGNENLGTRTGTLSESPFAEAGKDTVLLLGLNGNSTDRSRSRHAVTEVGSPTYVAADSLGAAYGSSLVFNGSDAYLTVPDNADWDIAGSTSQDYTIDFWVKFNTLVTKQYIVTQYESANDRWFMLWSSSSTRLEFQVITGGAAVVYLITPALAMDTDWHHVCLSKVTSSGPTVEWAIYLDGSQEAFVSDTSTDSFGAIIHIGQNGANGNDLNGHLNDFRIQKSNAFSAAPNAGKTDTITVPTIPHTADSDTALLLTFDEVTQGATPATITDSSLSPHTVTNVASKAVGCGYWWDGSIDLDGATQYLSIPDSADWDIAGSTSQDYTIDFWVKHTDHVGTEVYVAQQENGTNRWLFFNNSGNAMVFLVASGGSTIISLSGDEIADTDWHHVCLSKVTSSGPTVEWAIYLDGVQTAYLSDADTGTFTGSLAIAQTGAGSSYFDGQMDEVRITKSNVFDAAPVVGLTDTITVPTRPQV